MTHRNHHPASAEHSRLAGPTAWRDSHVADTLLVAAGRGDLEAFAAFYDETAAIVFGLLRAALANPVQAENTTRWVYVSLWRTAARFDPTTRSAYSQLLLTARRELVNQVHHLVTHNLASIPTADHRSRLKGDTRCTK